jgi:Fur family transcriptional regulator, ferric uptake regulator
MTLSTQRTAERDVFYAHLAKRGLRRTAQRDAVLEALYASSSHVTAEALYLGVRQQHPSIGFSTVYRTLKLLVECELARQVDFADGRTHFEAACDEPHHDHMICLRCGTAIEFSHPTIEALQDQIAADNQFVPVRHVMTIFGHCRLCS